MIAGVDIGGTKIALRPHNDNGAVVTRTEIPVQMNAARERARQNPADTAQTGSGDWCWIDGHRHCVYGPVDPITGELGDVNTLPGWQGWNPVRELADAFGLRQRWRTTRMRRRWVSTVGAGQGKRSLISITVGTGIGAGIILNGDVYRGANHAHPEIGHHIVEPDGPLCTCGAQAAGRAWRRGPRWSSGTRKQTRTTTVAQARRSACWRGRVMPQRSEQWSVWRSIWGSGCPTWCRY